MRLSLIFAGLAVACFAAPGAGAQDKYPSKPITVLVGFPAGTQTDTEARIVGQRISAKLGQPVVVLNKAGAGGLIALQALHDSQPDGYTIAVCNFFDVYNLGLRPQLGYKLSDLTTIYQTNESWSAIVIKSSLPPKTLAEFIDYAKKRPGELNYGQLGEGSAPHFMTKQFELLSGVSMVGVPYPGGPAALTELVAGRLDLFITGISFALEQERNGTGRILGVTSPTRIEGLPNLPTLKEQGIDLIAPSFFTWCGPKGMSRQIVDMLRPPMAEAVASEDYKKARVTLGQYAVNRSVEEAQKVILDFEKDVADTIKATGIKLVQ